MKVCFLCSNHLPEARGGTEQVTEALEQEYRRRGVEVVVIASSDVPDPDGTVALERWRGTPVHRIHKRRDEWDNSGFVRPRLLGIVRELLGRERPDVLHVHSTAALGTGCVAIAHELGIPIVWTFHDLWTTCARYFRLPLPGIRCPAGPALEACVDCIDLEVGAGRVRVEAALLERGRRVRADLELAAVCTAPSRATARTVRDCVPYARPIHVVPHGLLRTVHAEERTAGPRPGSPLRVGSFGGLGVEKGILELCAAVRGLTCELHLTGRHLGPAGEAALGDLQRSGMTVVQRDGYGPGDPHPARDLDLAVFPSRCQETYGLVVDEALAHGVPCVVSDNGALAERAGQPGVVVTALAKLPATLHDLVTRPDRIAALRRAIPSELPTIATAAARYLEFYRSIA
ncbi:MAG: glycosyltransferase [Planctomycetes bacterium]|nr:glycosyltransferase [Planctomycetota bacterium]